MTDAAWVRLLAVLSILLFFVPLVAPLLQGITLVSAVYCAWRRSLDRTSMVLAAVGAAVGFVLFLATEYIWIV